MSNVKYDHDLMIAYVTLSTATAVIRRLQQEGYEVRYVG